MFSCPVQHRDSERRSEPLSKLKLGLIVNMHSNNKLFVVLLNYFSHSYREFLS